ncbi:hypothetical protein ABPG75_013450 [Micractinium tetrahymenae]
MTPHPVVLATPLAGFTALQDLDLDSGDYGMLLLLETGLPASLTRLHLGQWLDLDASLDVMQQMSRLPRLRELSLRFAPYSAGDYEPLASLPELTALSLDLCQEIPGCLAQLRLRSLELVGTPFEGEDAPDDVAAQLAAAIAPLQSLTHLSLHPTAGINAPPGPVCASAAALSSLQSFAWLGGDPHAADPLPAGAWLASLRELVLPVRIAASSGGVLLTAQRLERLALDWQDGHEQLHIQVLRWAPHHPRLSTVAACLDSPVVVEEARHCEHARPSLKVVPNQGLLPSMSTPVSGSPSPDELVF